MSDIVFTSTDPKTQENTRVLFELIRDVAPRLLVQMQAELAALLEGPLDLNACNAEKDTLFTYAASKGHLHIMQELAQAGADLDQRTQNPQRPNAFWQASHHHQLEVMYWLIEAGADIHMHNPGKDGKTPLMDRTWRKESTVLEKLLARGADVNARENNGGTPLHMTTIYENGMAQFIEAGADVDAKDAHGDTPLILSATHTSNSHLDVLLAAGASFHAENRYSQTAMMKLGGMPAFEKAKNVKRLTEYQESWGEKLDRFRQGAYTPSTREDWNRLASILPIEDPKNPPSVASRLQMLHEMRPDISLGGLREKSLRLHQPAEGI